MRAPVILCGGRVARRAWDSRNRASRAWVCVYTVSHLRQVKLVHCLHLLCFSVMGFFFLRGRVERKETRRKWRLRMCKQSGRDLLSWTFLWAWLILAGRNLSFFGGQKDEHLSPVRTAPQLKQVHLMLMAFKRFQQARLCKKLLLTCRL